MTSWVYITQKLAQSAGIVLFLVNFCGDILLIIVFSTRRIYRTKPCTFFMLLSAIAGAIQLVNATVARVFSAGFNIDLTHTSTVLCKIREYSYTTAPGIAITFDWLSAVDQFLVTSRHVHLRQLSTMRLAYRLATGVVLFWLLHSIPFLILTDIKSETCLITSSVLQLYFNYVYFWLFSIIIPVIMLTVFGSLAYRNMHTLTYIHQLHGADRQRTFMVCIQVTLIIICVVPTTIYNLYAISTSHQIKSPQRKSIEIFVENFFGFTATFEFGGSFYLFLAVSSRFRREVKRCFCRWRKEENLVHPRNIDVRIAQQLPAMCST